MSETDTIKRTVRAFVRPKDVNDIPRRVCCVHQSPQFEQMIMSPSVKPHTKRVNFGTGVIFSGA